MNYYKDKVTIVTGAGSGIGQALCGKLGQLEAIVVASDINAQGVATTVAQIQTAGGRAEGEQLDVTDYPAFKRHIEGAHARNGRIDYIFNNAGLAVSGDLRDLEVGHWKKVLDVNLNGVFYGSLTAYKLMVKQGFGHIINMSSIEGFCPWGGNAPYVASKYAVLGFTQTLWVEGGYFGVHASAVCPGIIKTPIFYTSELIKADREKALAAQWKSIEKYSISPEVCAEIILKGISKKKPIIPVTRLAYIIWWMSRLNPVGLMKYIRKDFDKWRHDVRIAD